MDDRKINILENIFILVIFKYRNILYTRVGTLAGGLKTVVRGESRRAATIVLVMALSLFI